MTQSESQQDNLKIRSTFHSQYVVSGLNDCYYLLNLMIQINILNAFSSQFLKRKIFRYSTNEFLWYIMKAHCQI